MNAGEAGSKEALGKRKEKMLVVGMGTLGTLDE